MTPLRISYPTFAAAIMATGFSADALAQELDPKVLDTVVVTAGGHEQHIADAPASISVISREQLENQAYDDVVDIVKNIPGVFVTGGGSAQDISIRGQGAAYTLFMVDGKPISSGRSVNTNGSDGGKQIGLPPVSMIERVEVIRGPMSSLYGSDALGGVINIITRKNVNNWHGTMNIDFTHSMNDVSGDARTTSAYVAGPIIPGLLGIKVNGGYTGHDESNFVGGSDGAESRPETKRTQGGVEFVLSPDKDNVFKFEYQGAKQNTKHVSGVSQATPRSGAAFSEQEYKKDIYTLSHEGKFNGVNLKTYLQHDISDRVGDSIKKEKVTTFNSQGNYLLNDAHIITLGFNYKYEDFLDETNAYQNGFPGTSAQVDRWMAAVYGEVEWSVTDELNVTTGLRYDRDQNYGGHISPRIYGVYTVNPEWRIKGGVSSGYKQPGLASATAGFARGTGGSPRTEWTHGSGIIRGNPDLKPEESRNFEFGAAFDSADNKLQASLTAFHTNFKNKITEVGVCDSRRYKPDGTADSNYNNNQNNWDCDFGQTKYLFINEQVNTAKAVMQGIEATIDYNFASDWYFSSSYTFTKSKQKTGEFAGQPLNKQPRHMLNVGLNWNATSQLEVWTQANYRGKTSDYLSRTSMAEGTPSYAMWDFGVVYKIKPNARVKAAIYNVTDRTVTNSTYGVVLDGRRATVGLTVDF